MQHSIPKWPHIFLQFYFSLLLIVIFQFNKLFMQLFIRKQYAIHTYHSVIIFAVTASLCVRVFWISNFRRKKACSMMFISATFHLDEKIDNFCSFSAILFTHIPTFAELQKKSVFGRIRITSIIYNNMSTQYNLVKKLFVISFVETVVWLAAYILTTVKNCFSEL